MKKIHYLLLITMLFAGLASSPVTAAPPKGAPTDKDPEAYKGLTPKDIETIHKGEVAIIKDIGHEESTSKGFIKAAVIINQPLQKVYDLTAQDWRQDEYVPYLLKMTLIEKYADGNLDEELIKILFVTLHIRVRWYHHPQSYSFNWELDPKFKNDLRRLEGTWNFYYIDDTHTLGRYSTVSETGFGIPQSIQDYLTRKDLPEALNQVKLWLDSGSTYRKPGYKAPGK